MDLAGVDTVLWVARDAGLSGPVEVDVPANRTQAWLVSQVDTTWPVHLDRVAIDPTTAVVVGRSNFADWPLLAQLSKLGVQAHMGRLFGPVNQILLAALALGLVCVLVWGYRMWWQRRPTRADRPALLGTPPARGAWRQLPRWVVLVGVPVLLALGVALPLFGIPLAGFLVIDLILGWVRRRRDRAVPTSPAPAGA